jgi:hypothetical protein
VFPARRAGSTNAVSGFGRVKARLDAEMLALLRDQASEAGDDLEIGGCMTCGGQRRAAWLGWGPRRKSSDAP